METASQRARRSPRPAARRRAPSRGEQPFGDSGTLSRQFSDTTFLGDEGQIELRGRSRGSSGLSQVDDSPPRAGGRARGDSGVSWRSGSSLEDAIQPLQDTVEAVERAAARRGGTPPSPSQGGSVHLRSPTISRSERARPKAALAAGAGETLLRTASGTRPDEPLAKVRTHRADTQDRMKQVFSSNGQRARRRRSRAGSINSVGTDRSAAASVTFSLRSQQPARTSQLWPNRGGRSGTVPARADHAAVDVQDWIAKAEPQPEPEPEPEPEPQGVSVLRHRTRTTRSHTDTRPTRSHTAEDRWQAHRQRNMGRVEDGRAAGASQEREVAQRQRQQDREREHEQAEDKRRWLASEEAQKRKADEERRRQAVADKASREKLQHSEAEAKRRADKKVQERDAEIRRLSEEKQKLEAEHSAKMAKMSKRLQKEEKATRQERERASSDATRARPTRSADSAAKARCDRTHTRPLSRGSDPAVFLCTERG